MSRPGRRLSPEEAEIWARLAKTVVPLDPPRNGDGDRAKHGGGAVGTKGVVAEASLAVRGPPHPDLRRGGPPPRSGEVPRPHGLDANWERKLARGLAQSDFTLDLHGCTLDQAHSRLLNGLSQAKAMGARLVLLVTGKPRHADAADRGQQRGAIRAKVIDWLAASEHALDIAAIRGAHRRHGGSGALYVVLKRKR